MARLFSPFRRLCRRAYSSRAADANFSVFQEGDRVLINTKTPILTKPLRNDDKTQLPRGFLNHVDIIGKTPRDPIKSKKGAVYRATHPTFEDYIVRTPRLVTPIYPADANLIVSLLDIHVAPPAPGERPKEPLEILEAGTGHGSLTLHLARAINAANSCPPTRPPCSQRKILELPETKKKPVEEKKVVEKEDREAQAEIEGLQREWDGWRAQRNAIVHTVEISPHYSQHAENIVRGFRRGIYVGNVDFYVSSVEKWIKEQVTRRSTNERSPDPFLSHVILDMPSAHLRIPHVAPTMRDDAVLAVFMPSITQLGDCVDLISKQKLPLIQEKVVELGTGISSGRLWELRMATKRSSNDTLSQEAIAEEMSDETSEGATDTEAEDSTSLSKREKTNGDEVLVCRPQVGARIAGGGFVGIWRKKKA
ncbi:tRNA (adenine-N(1)-)-methyltransferase [Histoplasma capsulatum G186AR]|uniref:tRNA (adenine(58)-N(1))-methyltransferase catalytic subunit TRM61 n=1 Tax=Ajellomyces capsulatus TaxID=5037 RepID=A0A8H7ZA71_AJECA|nr:tRNA (adenine-N(1)-)-methyltransferase [Histoplasma capsulatum]QSS70215.1 tRNA (adenine-N(1)-)-methyltransferase [Histoplasma capsulatum G186AR]